VAPIKRHGWQRRAGPKGADPIVLMMADACLLGCSGPAGGSNSEMSLARRELLGFIIKNIYFVHPFFARFSVEVNF
jgi:hypothetical protein